jgi:hypothetical protein
MSVYSKNTKADRNSSINSEEYNQEFEDEFRFVGDKIRYRYKTRNRNQFFALKRSRTNQVNDARQSSSMKDLMKDVEDSFDSMKSKTTDSDHSSLLSD